MFCEAGRGCRNAEPRFTELTRNRGNVSVPPQELAIARRETQGTTARAIGFVGTLPAIEAGSRIRRAWTAPETGPDGTDWRGQAILFNRFSSGGRAAAFLPSEKAFAGGYKIAEPVTARFEEATADSTSKLPANRFGETRTRFHPFWSDTVASQSSAS